MNTHDLCSDILLIEEPTLTSACVCGCAIKRTTTHFGHDVQIEFPYLINAIYREDGHSYEVVSDYFQHRCPLTIAASHSLKLAAAV